MSYDYNALLLQVTTSRGKAAGASDAAERLEFLQQSVDALSTLSGHCPMTPLLWMQYSKDMADLLLQVSEEDGSTSIEAVASAQETRLQLLELALSEFPGSAILHLHYLQILLQRCSDTEKITSAFTLAFENVGNGSHRNEGILIASIFQLAIQFYAQQGEIKVALELFVRRAQTPMKDVNDSLLFELEQFCKEQSIDISDPHRRKTQQLMDEARRYESRMYNFLITCEDEVDSAMHQEGILPRHQVNLEELSWDKILKSDDKHCWMGLGGMLSSHAFIQYAQACYRYRAPIGGKKSDLSAEEQQQIQQDEAVIHNLALCVYERGIAECPTVESLWVSYIRHMEYLVPRDRSVIPRLKRALERAVRNCPYSVLLYQQKLELQGLLADHDVSVLDPEELQKVVQDAIDSKFIPSKEACLNLYMTATTVLRRRILNILAKETAHIAASNAARLSYDDPEPFDPAKRIVATLYLNDETKQELEDLCDDCRELYETIDVYLRKSHGSWIEGRGRVWSERAYLDAVLLTPLAAALGSTMDSAEDERFNQLAEVAKLYDKLIKVYQPTPPDCYIHYIQSVQNLFPTTGPQNLITKFRNLRYLYEKALKSTGKPKQQSELLDPFLQRDFDSGLRHLCHEYLVFERYFGSDKSLANASAAIQKKLSKYSTNTKHAPLTDTTTVTGAVVPEEMATAMEVDEHQSNRELTMDENNLVTSKKHTIHEHENTAEPPLKKVKTGDEPAELVHTNNDGTSTVQKVRIGNLEYPAHPFTVRVLNLSLDTEDMDLVDAFRSKCGAIVHAKIVREKHPVGKGRSKGWGLIQFELQESVEKALALSEVIGIREKLVKVDRSHMPAVGLVPPGMHRVKPQGEGKSSKKNKKRREAKVSHTPATDETTDPTPLASNTPSATAMVASAPPSATSILSLKPRGVQQKQLHRKVKVSLKTSESH